MIQQTKILTYNAMQYEDDALDLRQPINLFIGLPGVGESADITKIKAAGSPFATLTATAKKNMAIWWVQPGVSWGLMVSQIDALIAAIRSKYTVNAMALFGYSLGAQQWAEWAETSEISFAKVQAFYFASADTEGLSPQYGTATFNPALWAKYRIRDVRTCGTADAGFWGTQNQKAAAITAALPQIPNVFQPVAGAAHSSAVWGPFSDINGKIPLLGNVDIYADFNTWFPPAAAVVVPPAQMPATLMLTSATLAQLATTRPNAPAAYLNPVTKTIIVWNGTIWQ